MGANYRAACNAATRPLFVHKMSIVVEEADETVYWLEMIRDAERVKPDKIADLASEAEQVLKIMSASLRTAHQPQMTR